MIRDPCRKSVSVTERLSIVLASGSMMKFGFRVIKDRLWDKRAHGPFLAKLNVHVNFIIIKVSSR